MNAQEFLESYASGNRDFAGTDLRRAALSDADLRDIDLSVSELDRANLASAVLTYADLPGAYLRRANLSDANLSDANLSDADFTDANLSDADLTHASLTGANLTGANLTGADLDNANIIHADLAGATMPDGRLWEEYKLDHLAGICDTPEVKTKAIEAWGEHSWESCPMNAALGIESADEAGDKADAVATWVALYDSELLSCPSL